MNDLKGLICYHSNTGNTVAVVKFLAQQMDGVTFDLHNVTDATAPDFGTYDVIGCVTWTYYLGVPPLMADWLADMPDLAGKPVFLMNTYGVMPGWTLKRMAETIAARNGSVIGAYSFHTPESYPPFIVKGWDSVDAPEPADLASFEAFVAELEVQLTRIGAGQTPELSRVKLGWFDYVIRPSSVEKARRKMGALVVDAALCTGCATCAAVCHYNAIDCADGPPQFDAAQCHSCFACFNHCPAGAIFTEKLKGEHKAQYAGPDEIFLAKLR